MNYEKIIKTLAMILEKKYQIQIDVKIERRNTNEISLE